MDSDDWVPLIDFKKEEGSVVPISKLAANFEIGTTDPDDDKVPLLDGRGSSSGTFYWKLILDQSSDLFHNSVEDWLQDLADPRQCQHFFGLFLQGFLTLFHDGRNDGFR